MTLIKNDHYVLAVHRVTLVRLDERRQFLDRGDDDACVWVFQLLLEHCRRGVRVRGPLLEAVVLAHCLVVQVLAVNDEQHLVDAWQLRRQLRCLE